MIKEINHLIVSLFYPKGKNFLFWPNNLCLLSISPSNILAVLPEQVWNIFLHCDGSCNKSMIASKQLMLTLFVFWMTQPSLSEQSGFGTCIQMRRSWLEYELVDNRMFNTWHLTPRREEPDKLSKSWSNSSIFSSLFLTDNSFSLCSSVLECVLCSYLVSLDI